MNPNDLLKTKIGQDPVNRELIAAAARCVGAVSHSKREQTSVSPLVSRVPLQSGRQVGLAVVVTLTSCRRVLVDDDNLIAGAKSLRDSIATSLGIDDFDPRIKWEYRQQQTDGAEGTIVTITRVCRTSRSSKSKSTKSTPA